MNRVGLKIAAAALFALAVGYVSGISPAYAGKVDCDAVMQELNGGKKVKEVALDQKISRTSVYKCRQKAKAAATASNAGNEVAAKPAASPAAAKP
jgi:hypothetical protein